MGAAAMTSPISLTVTHEGQTFYGHIATIKSTTLGWEDHGILTAMLDLTWDGSGVGVGGYCLDQTTGGPDYGRRGTAYGLDHIMRIMETVGVDRWEKLPGSRVVVLFESENAWGGTSRGIAGLQNGRVFLLKEHAEAWQLVEAS